MRLYWKFWHVLINSSSTLITPFPVNESPNILVANALNNIGRSTLFYSFVSFLIVSLIPFISNPDCSIDLTIFIISSISSLEVINAVRREGKSKGRPYP